MTRESQLDSEESEALLGIVYLLVKLPSFLASHLEAARLQRGGLLLLVSEVATAIQTAQD